MSTYQQVSLSITGRAHLSGGMATEYDDGSTGGHVTIYTDGGAWSIRADSPETLRDLSKAFAQAAEALEAKRSVTVSERPVAAMGGMA